MIRLSRQYEVYSDASYDDQKSLGVFAYIVLKPNGTIHAQGIEHAKYANVFRVEIAGLLAGLNTVPKRAKVRSHSDIRAFAKIFERGYRSKHKCIRELMALIDERELDFVNEFERDRNARHDFYRLCDQRSNLHMRALVGRGGKTLG